MVNQQTQQAGHTLTSAEHAIALNYGVNIEPNSSLKLCFAHDDGTIYIHQASGLGKIDFNNLRRPEEILQALQRLSKHVGRTMRFTIPLLTSIQISGAFTLLIFMDPGIGSKDCVLQPRQDPFEFPFVLVLNGELHLTGVTQHTEEYDIHHSRPFDQPATLTTVIVNT